MIENGTEYLMIFVITVYINIFFRHGAIQTRGQMEVIREFEQYLKPLRIIFALE